MRKTIERGYPSMRTLERTRLSAISPLTSSIVVRLGGLSMPSGIELSSVIFYSGSVKTNVLTYLAANSLSGMRRSCFEITLSLYLIIAFSAVKECCKERGCVILARGSVLFDLRAAGTRSQDCLRWRVKSRSLHRGRKMLGK